MTVKPGMTGKLERQERTGMTVTGVVTGKFASVPHNHDRVTLPVAKKCKHVAIKTSRIFSYFCSTNITNVLSTDLCINFKLAIKVIVFF